MNNISSAVALAKENDEQYAMRWFDESTVWSECGLYEEIVSHIDLKSEHCHIDVCSGFATPLFLLNDRAPKDAKLQLIALERVEMMLESIANHARKLGVLGGGHIHSVIEYDETAKIMSRRYPIALGFTPENFFGAKTAVSLIQDDVRSANVFRHLMGNRKADSATFLFPGTSQQATFEAPYRLDEEITSADEEQRRIGKHMQETRYAAISLAAEYLKPGGTFLMSERAFVGEEVTERELSYATLENFQKVAGNMTGAWGRAVVFASHGDVSEAQSSLDWALTDRQGKKTSMRDIKARGLASRGRAAVVIAKVTRNDVSFDDLKRA